MIVELNLLFCGILFHTTSVSIDRGRRRHRDRMVVGFDLRILITRLLSSSSSFK
jgi:hypothetical protein